MYCQLLHSRKKRPLLAVATVLPFLLLGASPNHDDSFGGIEGFTTPYRVLQIGAPEAGIVEEMLVREGDKVQQGDVLAKLDCDVHLALLAIAEKSMQLEGQLQSANAEMSHRQRRLALIRRLDKTGHARPEELERAKADFDIAKGNVLSAQEQLIVKQLEYEKIMAQIKRRSVRAPLDGVVTTLLKQSGEFAAPNDPQLLVLVQLDPLLAEFSVPWDSASQMKVDDTVTVVFDGSNAKITGKVEFISPLTDAESGTVLTKVRLNNTNSTLRSGDRCRLRLEN